MNWTPDIDAKIRSLSEQGWTALQIADLLGVTRNAVCGRKFRLGIKSGKPGKPFSDNERAIIFALHREGLTYREIGERVGRATMSVWHVANPGARA